MNGARNCTKSVAASEPLFHASREHALSLEGGRNSRTQRENEREREGERSASVLVTFDDRAVGEVGRVAELNYSLRRGRGGREGVGCEERRGRETQFGFVEPAWRRLATRVAEFTLLAERR